MDIGKITLPLILSAICLTMLGCATAYQPSGLTGGFEETRLSKNRFEVYFQGNGFSLHSRVSKLLLRRCAELTLENGFKYFIVETSQQRESYGGGGGYLHTFPNGQATIRLVSFPQEQSVDAIAVIEQTDELAKGRLSTKAAQEIQRLR